MKAKLDVVLTATIDYCFKEGLLLRHSLPKYVIEIPNNPDHGHFATNLALVLAKSQKKPPRKIASIILNNLIDNQNIIAGTEIAGPGFINVIIKSQQWYDRLSEIIRLKKQFGRTELGKGQKIVVEFVSANPTGPLHLGHGRGAALGDTLCRILSNCGYDVTREFYINDAGQQIRILGESIYSTFKRINDHDYPFPQNGYHADYIHELAQIISQMANLDNLPAEESINFCAQKGKELMLNDIKKDLERFRVKFHTWSSEKNIHNNGLLENTLEKLEKKDLTYKSDGALWIKTADYNDDKNRVLRKKDGQFTYFASDIAYHLEKKRRGFTGAINLWGADHHGYVPRIQSVLVSHGIPENWLSVMLIQLVKLWRGGCEFKMSKRSGHFVTLLELIEEVGVDAARFVFLSKSHDSGLDFDIDMVKKQDSTNPVYYIQYAHARICSIFRKAALEGILIEDNPDNFLGNLVLDEELALIRALAGFPSLLDDICLNLEPHRLTYYLTSVAAMFHKYFNLGAKVQEYRIINKDIQLTLARLFLIDGIRTVLSSGLDLLGISAPQKM